MAVAHGPGGDKGRPKPTPTATATAAPTPTATAAPSPTATAAPSPTASPAPSPTAVAPSASPGAGAIGGHVSVGSITLSVAVVPGSGGKPAQARVAVTNQTRAALGAVVVGLRSADAGVVIRPMSGTTIKRLGPLAAGTVGWTVCVTGTGTRVITLVASATTGGQTLSSHPYPTTLAATHRC